MPTGKIIFGGGTTLDVDDMSVGDGMGVSFYNCYLDRSGSIRRFPGLTLEHDLGIGNYKVYAYFSKIHNLLVIVSKGRLWTLTNGGVPVELTGSVLEIDVKPAFAEDGTSIFVAANSAIQYFALGDVALSTVGGNSPTNCWTLAFAFGYLLANGNEVAGDTTYSDDVANNYATWEVYNNETSPDVLQSLIVQSNEYVYNIGTQSIEVTYQSGDASNPWALNPGRIMSFGTMARYSPAYDGQNIFMLSETTESRKVLVFPGGGSPEIISFPIDLPIENFESVADAEGFVMGFKGQNFYCLRFPSANTTIDEQPFEEITFAYHLQAKAWYVLAAWDIVNGDWKEWRGVDFTYAEPWGKQYVGGRDGKLYSFYDDNTIDYSVEYLLTHRWRNDGNKTWNLPRIISLGTSGEYTRPSEQRQCGVYHSRQHELTYSDSTDAGETFRLAIKSGNVNHGTVSRGKRNHRYIYNVKRGTNDFVIDKTGIEEDFEFLRR